MIIDPLHNQEAARIELFRQMAKLGNGFTADEVVAACFNVLANALRQAHPTRDSVMQRADQLNAELKTMLDKHYDLLGRRLKGAFPYHQMIEPEMFDARVKIK